jgi:hypothetical protein
MKTMENVLAKGQNFVYAREFFQKKYGNEIVEKVIENLPQEIAEIWDGQLFITGTYPFSAFKAFIFAISKELKIQKDIENALVYEYIAEKSLNILYRMFFKFAEPSFVIKNYPKLWDRFFTTGKVEVPVAEKEHAELKFTLPEIFLDWLPSACLGYSKKAVEMAGAKDLIMKVENKLQLENNLWEVIIDLNWKE